MSAREVNKESRKLLLFQKWRKKHGDVSVHLKCNAVVRSIIRAARFSTRKQPALLNDSRRSLFNNGDLRLSLCFPLYLKFNSAIST